MVKHAPKHDPPIPTVVVIALVVGTVAGPTTDGDRQRPESEDPAPSATRARPGGKALTWAVLAVVTGVALVATGLAATGGLLATIWGGVLLALADALLRSLRSSEPRGGS